MEHLSKFSAFSTGITETWSSKPMESKKYVTCASDTCPRRFNKWEASLESTCPECGGPVRRDT